MGSRTGSSRHDQKPSQTTDVAKQLQSMNEKLERILSVIAPAAKSEGPKEKTVVVDKKKNAKKKVAKSDKKKQAKVVAKKPAKKKTIKKK